MKKLQVENGSSYCHNGRIENRFVKKTVSDPVHTGTDLRRSKIAIGFSLQSTHGSVPFGVQCYKADPFGSVPDLFPRKCNEIVPTSYPKQTALLDPSVSSFSLVQ